MSFCCHTAAYYFRSARRRRLRKPQAVKHLRYNLMTSRALELKSVSPTGISRNWFAEVFHKLQTVLRFTAHETHTSSRHREKIDRPASTATARQHHPATLPASLAKLSAALRTIALPMRVPSSELSFEIFVTTHANTSRGVSRHSIKTPPVLDTEDTPTQHKTIKVDSEHLTNSYICLEHKNGLVSSITLIRHCHIH